MYELSQIILWILWTLRPAMAVETNLIDIIRSGFALFGDDETLEAMANDPDHCAIVASALCDAHAKLDLMIYLRACELAGIRPRSRGFEPDFTTTGSRHTPETCWRSFRRLVLRFEDRERLAHLRAIRLKREAQQSPLRLAPSAQSTSPALCAVEATHRALFNVQIASLSAQHWGRWIARACAQDGGGCAQPRAPPRAFDHSDCRPNHLSRLATGIAPACALRAQSSGHSMAVLLQHHDHAAAVSQFLNAELRHNTAICDDFAKSLFGFSPGLEALSPLGIGHDARRSTFDVEQGRFPATQPINQAPALPIF